MDDHIRVIIPFHLESHATPPLPLSIRGAESGLDMDVEAVSSISCRACGVHFSFEDSTHTFDACGYERSPSILNNRDTREPTRDELRSSPMTRDKLMVSKSVGSEINVKFVSSDSEAEADIERSVKDGHHGADVDVPVVVEGVTIEKDFPRGGKKRKSGDLALEKEKTVKTLKEYMSELNIETGATTASEAQHTAIGEILRGFEVE